LEALIWEGLMGLNKDEFEKIRNSFMRQSYRDSWNDYKHLLESGRNINWDWFVITASNDEQAQAYEMQIQYRQSNGWLPANTRYLVISDPECARVGSGGATLNVLRHILECSSESDPFTGKRILIVHSGGDSKRVPQNSACGKLFSYVPHQLPDGRNSTLFDEILIGFSGVPARMSDGMLVMSGDVLLIFNPLQIDLQREGSACISVKAPIETGVNHGVFLSGDNGDVKSYLHKQSKAYLEIMGAVNNAGCVDIDTGIVWMSSRIIKDLVSLFYMNGEICRDKLEQYVNDNVRLSFYEDFIFPMTTDSTLEAYLKQPSEGTISHSKLLECRRALWAVLNSYPLQMIKLAPAEFIHLGTTQELRDFMLHSKDKYGFLGWGCKTVGNSNTVTINSIINKEALIGSNTYIEDSFINSSAKVGMGCVVSNADISGNLSADTVLHVLPIRLNDKQYFIARIYGVYDNPKLGLDTQGTFLEIDLSEMFNNLDIPEDEIWDSQDRSLWNAKLYSVCESKLQAIEMAQILQNIALGSASSTEVVCWRESLRMSLAESFQKADIEKILSGREKLEDSIRTSQFIESVFEGSSFQEVISLLETGIALKRRMRLICEKVKDHTAIQRSRILRVLSEISRFHAIVDSDLNPNLLEESSYKVINEFIRKDGSYSPNISDARITQEHVEIEVPVRVNWGGGWSDTTPYCIEYGGTVLNAALSLHGKCPIKVIVQRLEDPIIVLESRDLKCINQYKLITELMNFDNPSDPFAIHKAALAVMSIVPAKNGTVSLNDQLTSIGGGIYLCTDVEVPKGSGLGTSSILAGAIVKALSQMLGQSINDQFLFDQVIHMQVFRKN
jgi:fucokinase